MIQVEPLVIIPYDFTADPVNFALGVKDERLAIQVTFQAVWFLQSDADNKAEFTGNTITINDFDDDPIVDIWERQEFRVGDVVGITLSVSNNVTRNITAISADGATITVDGAALTLESSILSKFNGETPLTGISYKYNFIENDDSENYNSLVDGNENKYALAGLTTAMGSTPTVHQGQYKSNKIGDITIEGTANLNEFIITQDINLVPFCLAGQLSDIQNEIAPTYYFDLACLRYIYDIKLHRVLTDPNFIHESNATDFQQGNTGDTNENFNAGPPEYTLDSLVFKNAGGDVITQPDYSKVNTVEIVVDSANARFTNTDRRVTMQHSYIPTDSSEHTDTTTDMETNFMFDQNVVNSAGVPANGRGFGTGKQVLTDITATFTSTTKMLVTGKLDLSAAYQTRLDSLAGNFYLGVTTQDPSLSTEDSDKVHVFSGAAVYTKDLSDTAAGGVETCFISHPESSTEPVLVPDESATMTGLNYGTIPASGADLLVLDSTNTKTIGVAAWQGTKFSTIEKLRDSINDNVAYGTVFGGAPAYIDNGGYNTATASTLPGFNIVNFLAPAGTAYNGAAVQLHSSLGGNISNNVFAGGTDVLSLVCTPDAGFFVEDWQIGKSEFFVEDNTDSVIKEVRVTIYAEHATYGTFNLEDRTFNTQAAPIVSGVQIIDIEGLRGYQMKAGNIFNEYSIKRKSSLDVGTRKYYELLYDFKIRWEDFLSLPGVSSQFFDPTQDHQGYNNNWNRYFATAGWTLKYKVNTVITKDTFDNNISLVSNVDAYNYDDADDWTYTTKAFDILTGNEVTGNAMTGRKYRIEVDYTKTVGTPPDIAKVSGSIGVAPTGAGGNKLIRETSTIHPFEPTTPWISEDNNELCRLVKVGAVYRFTGIIDNVKLKNIFPTATSFDFTHRIEEAEAENLRITGDQIARITGDGQQRLVAT